MIYILLMQAYILFVVYRAKKKAELDLQRTLIISTLDRMVLKRLFKNE